ncbi:MAG: PTS transporter subunit IIC [Lachnospirales bacterium]
MNMTRVKNFLKKKNVEISFKRYGIDALGFMAQGLFASLIISLILKEFGTKLDIPILVDISAYAAKATGASIGVAIAYSLQAPPLVIFSNVAVGLAGNELGGPAGAYIACLIATEIGKLISKETIIDIIITPIVTTIIGVIIAIYIGTVISSFTTYIGNLIMWATELMPFTMGIIVSVVMGIVLTLPISSAALSIMLELGGLAGGAAVAGCCAQMVGFAVASYRENKLNGLLSQGLGTSMLQMPNIMKNPRIWIPPILASAITGPLSTVVFKMENIPTGSGMGTSGLVGQFGALTAMGYNMHTYISIAIVHFIAPAILTLIFSELLRKKGYIKENDMKLNL